MAGVVEREVSWLISRGCRIVAFFQENNDPTRMIFATREDIVISCGLISTTMGKEASMIPTRSILNKVLLWRGINWF